MPVKTKQTEADLQRAILAYVNSRPDCWCMRVNAGKIQKRNGGWVTLAPEGVSDIVGWVTTDGEWFLGDEYCSDPGPAIFLAIEVKGPKGRVSPEQQAYLDAVNAAGGFGFIARSIDDVIERLGRS